MKFTHATILSLLSYTLAIQACHPPDPAALAELKQRRAMNAHVKHRRFPLHHEQQQQRRQTNGPPPPAGPPSSSTSSTNGNPAPTGTGTGTGTVVAAPGTTTTASSTVNPATFPVPTDPFATIPIDQIVSGAPPEPSGSISATFAPGSAPTYIPSAPGLPDFQLNPANYPPLNKVPPADSEQVQTWLKEIQGIDPAILNIRPTVDGSVVNDSAAVADTSRCWWTANGCAGPQDIVACPQKDTWGLTFDDGPSPYTPKVLKFLNDHQLKGTFFVVGSRLMDVNGPDRLKATYMQGNQIAVHTWSHSVPLTALTNEEVVAELGWSRKVINDILGVTPIYMRPPWGDIDNRIRAISLAMGMTPIIWTRNPQTLEQFDTNDWRVAGGQVTGQQSLQSFNYILGNASLLNTGFIVLQHDLYQVEVDLSTGYTIPLAIQNKFNILDVNTCVGHKPADAYLETIANKSAIPTFPGAGQGVNLTSSVQGNSDGSSNQGGVAQGSSGTLKVGTSLVLSMVAAVMLGASALVLS